MSLIADLTWIKRGVPKAIPNKVKSSSKEIRTLIQDTKRDGSVQKHSGALAWNRLTEHILASGGADNSVIFWNLKEVKSATVATHFHGMIIQCISASCGIVSSESSILLTRTLSSQVGLTDCREFNNLSRHWEVSGEVERFTWNHFSPFYFFVVTDNVISITWDTRKNEPAISKKVYEGGARSVVQSC
uniref:WD_REPEATS_REGION domain-containing protein n=1 Tax=Wuchereria bancrofti TaxID=6293 RepID=A0A1I8ESK4_WUCBA